MVRWSFHFICTRIRDHNAAAEQEKLDKSASTRKRAGSAGPKEVAKSSRVASRQPVEGEAASSSQAPASRRAGQRTAKQYRDSAQRVQDASSIDDVRAVLASVQAPSGPTPPPHPPSKRALSPAQTAPATKAIAYPWRAQQSQASSSWDGDQVASRQPDHQPSDWVVRSDSNQVAPWRPALRGDDTQSRGSTSDPWENWRGSNWWKDSRW